MAAGIPGAVPATDPDRAVVYVGRYHVVLPDCPDWHKQTAADFTNTPSSNYGCATTVNFARMLADPGDLVQGRDPGPSDGERLAGTIRAYRDAGKANAERSEEHTSELQSLMRISYAVFCLKKKTKHNREDQ